MDLHTIPMDALSVSAINVRKTPEDIEQLAASIKTVGLLSPIIVRPNGSPNTYEIIAGQRRYLAMKQNGATEIPAFISQQPDDLTSLEISLAENFSRADLDPIEACEAFMAIKATSEQMTVLDLANRFGVSAQYVKQRLKLAELPENIRKFAKKQGLSIHLLEALTIAPPHVQKSWLAAAKKGEWGWQDADAIRRQSTAEKPRQGDNVFDVSLYTGTYTTDLFEHVLYFDDIVQFDTLQAEAVEAVADKLRSEGWSWVKGYTTQAGMPSIYTFGKSKNKKTAGAIVAVVKTYENNQYTGRKIEIHTGLLDPDTVRKLEKEAKKAAAAEAVETGSDKDAETDGGKKEQTQILARCHDELARATNSHAVLKCRDHSDLLTVICDLIADRTIRFETPRVDSDVQAIIGQLSAVTPGTEGMKVKMNQSLRIGYLRKLLASAVTSTDMAVARIGSPREIGWTPGEAYFQKLDKERLAVCLDEIGHSAAAELRSGKMKRAAAAKMLTSIFAGEENSATRNVIKAAQSWVPVEYLEACKPREYIKED